MKQCCILLFLFATCAAAQDIPSPIQTDIDHGNFTKAQKALDSLVTAGILPEIQRLAFRFEIERMERIRKDFSRTREDILPKLQPYYPRLTEEQFTAFEADGSLEMKIIDGKKQYFSNAAPNLFRINREAKMLKAAIDGPPKDELRDFLKTYLPTIVKAADASSQPVVCPVPMTLTYSLTVKPNAVPDGENIRCWLPYPRETHARQSAVTLLSVSEPNFVLAANDVLQRTLYLEKRAIRDVPTVFSMKLSFTGAAEYFHLFDKRISGQGTLSADSLRLFTAERPPHIVFTPEIQSLSKRIIGTERDPMKKAQLIFSWISGNIPWASALEYSTIPDISAYCLKNRHGDCGIQSLLFITLCRYNGIPAKWQSGWMLYPPEVNLHDWSEIFLEGIGWVPVDQSFGVQQSSDERVKFFYLGGIDAYRLIVNDDYSRDLYPAKIYPRSETVDFQRGEVEWRGGNLYFDAWQYHMDVQYGTTAPQ